MSGHRRFLVVTMALLLVLVPGFWVGAQAKPVTLSVLTSTGILENGINIAATEYQKKHPEVKFDVQPLPGSRLHAEVSTVIRCWFDFI